MRSLATSQSLTHWSLPQVASDRRSCENATRQHATLVPLYDGKSPPGADVPELQRAINTPNDYQPSVRRERDTRSALAGYDETFA